MHEIFGLHSGTDYRTRPNFPNTNQLTIQTILDRIMSFAVVIMNSTPSWSIRLASSGHTDDQAQSDDWPAVFLTPAGHRPIFGRPQCISLQTTCLLATSLIFPTQHWLNRLTPVSRPSVTFCPTPWPQPVSLNHSCKSSSVMLQNSSFLMAA